MIVHHIDIHRLANINFPELAKKNIHNRCSYRTLIILGLTNFGHASGITNDSAIQPIVPGILIRTGLLLSTVREPFVYSSGNITKLISITHSVFRVYLIIRVLRISPVVIIIAQLWKHQYHEVRALIIRVSTATDFSELPKSPLSCSSASSDIFCKASRTEA